MLRAGFSEWQTLPDQVSTDNELRFIGNPSSDFPGAAHPVPGGLRHSACLYPSRTTHRYAQVEREIAPLDNWTFSAEDLQDLAHFQQALDPERRIYLLELSVPCQRLSGSATPGRPSGTLHPRRFYQPALEPLLFSMPRVFDFLATFTFDASSVPVDRWL